MQVSIILWLIFGGLPVYCQPVPVVSAPQESAAAADMKFITSDDRVLIIAPHPDDETIGCAGIIQQAQQAGADIHILYLTNGDHNQVAFMVYEKRLTFRKGEFIHMGEVRRKEAVNAMKLLGVSEDRLIFLGYPDFGTFSIFRNFWQEDKPYKSMLTRVSAVPYADALSSGRSYVGQSILNDFEAVLRKYRPNKIFVTAAFDTNPDHKAAYLFLEIALADSGIYPEVHTYLIHRKAWPLPRHYHPELELDIPDEANGRQMSWFRYRLPAEEIEKKRQATLCYKSQTESSAFYLLAFCRKNELFGQYPEINLKTAEPQAAKDAPRSWQDKLGLFLERYSGKRWFLSDEPAQLPQASGAADKRPPVVYELRDGLFVIEITKPRNIKYQFGTLIYLFGYSYGAQFATMPKICIITKHNRMRVFSGKKEFVCKDITLKLESERLILTMPVSLLGNPDFILASVREYPENLYADYSAFRKVKLSPH